MDFMDRMNYINLMNLSLSLMDEEEKLNKRKKIRQKQEMLNLQIKRKIYLLC